MISDKNDFFNENKKTNEKMTHTQSKFDELASDKDMLQTR